MDVIGCTDFPIVSQLADGSNALLYALEGKYIYAGISLFAVVPVYGTGGIVVKYLVKTGDAIKGARAIRTLNAFAGIAYINLVKKYSYSRVADAIVDSGKSFYKNMMGKSRGLTNKLRKALQETDEDMTGKAAHHIIPTQLIEESATVREAIEQGFEFNSKANGIALSTTKHSGPHSDYTKKLKSWIGEGLKDGKSAKEAVEFAVDKAKDYIS